MFQTFQHQKFGKVRTLFIDGVLHFVGKDVATALGYKDTVNALKLHVDFEDKKIVDLNRVEFHHPINDAIFGGGWIKNEVTVINESGLYSLIFNSKLPEAKEFRHWVTSEVLPQIRKTGSFSFEKPPELPELPPLYYKGEKVLTTKQLTEFFDCSRQVVTASFRYNRLKFEIGVDYFYLSGAALKDFKIEIAGKNFSPPVSHLASTLYLWTESGTLKLSKYIGTDRAKVIYSTLALKYFKVEKNISAESEKILSAPQIQSADKIETLKFLIEHCTDDALRDDLIRCVLRLID